MNKEGSVRDDEFRKKMSEARKGKPSNAKGKHWVRKVKVEKPKEMYVMVYDPYREDPWNGDYRKVGDID